MTSWKYEDLGHDYFNYVDIAPELDGSDYGQYVFDKNTQKLSHLFSCDGVKVYTGIGYVVTQAIKDLPFELVAGTYHKDYNPDPETGPKKKVYIGKYELDKYFSTKEFTKYPDCNHIIITDWNKKAIQMMMDIIVTVPHMFEGKQITIVHGNIKSPISIRTMREIAERDYKLPITSIYVTNIVNTFIAEDIELFAGLSSVNVQLRCDTMNPQYDQLIVNTVGDHEPIYVTDTDASIGAEHVSPKLRQRPEKRDETRISPAPYGGAARKTKRTYRKKSFHKLYAKCMLYHRLKSKKKLSTPRFTISSVSSRLSASRTSASRKYGRGRTH
jgi:hypothetical protein